MNILFLAAEVAPFVSVGGLSQVMFFLPQTLRNQGHDVRIFTAKYGAMDDTAASGNWKLRTELQKLAVPIDSKEEKSVTCNIKSYRDKHGNILSYFLENREYYELRANVFGYRDDHIRFALLSKGCLEWLRIMNKTQNFSETWWPDIIHCHDWHTGFFIDYARRDVRYKELLHKVSLTYTVHNFSFQGNYDFRYCRKEDFDSGIELLAPLDSPKLQKQNALKRGIMYADAINTVSPTHAVEVLTPEYAEGLDDILQEEKDKLTGILNGLDIHEFNPHTDKKIKKRYNIHSFVKAKEENKKELQKIFGLPQDTLRPLIAFSGRLAKQKGLDLLLKVLPPLLTEKSNVQFIFLGSGDDRYRLELTVLQKTFPEQIGLHLRPDFNLPRKIFAGADMITIPSLFEPGGIVALEALRYGCVPIVCRTGGLNDIITDFNPNTKEGNGFSFKNKDQWALYGSLIESLTYYKNPKLWRNIITNCMASDFSWHKVALEYDDWYKKIVKERIALLKKPDRIQFTPHNI